MNRWRELLGNERGTALALALISLVIMTALAIGLATMGGVEARISAGQSASTRARLLAESGIEYALLSLAGVGFTDALQAGTVTVDPDRVLIAAGTTLPGLGSGYGTFGVTIRNDINAGDNLMTGAAACATCAPAETGNATSDSNGVVILTSTGTVDGATRVVVAVVQRGNLGINAALTLPGVQADTTTDNPCQNPACPPNPSRNYSIDGRDWRRTDGVVLPTGTADSSSASRRGLGWRRPSKTGSTIATRAPTSRARRDGWQPHVHDATHDGSQHDRRRHHADARQDSEVHANLASIPRPRSSTAPRPASSRRAVARATSPRASR